MTDTDLLPAPEEGTSETISEAIFEATPPVTEETFFYEGSNSFASGQPDALMGDSVSVDSSSGRDFLHSEAMSEDLDSAGLQACRNIASGKLLRACVSFNDIIRFWLCLSCAVGSNRTIK